MPSPPAPEKPTWRRRRTRRRNLNRDAVRAPLRPRRGRLAGKSVPGGGAGHRPATQAGRAVLLLLDAARLSARLGHTSGCRGREPPPGPAAPATAFRAAPEAAEAPRLRAACTPRAPGSRTALGRGSWGGGGRGGTAGARGGDRRAQRLHVEGERTVTSRHSGRQTDATWIEQTRTVGFCVYSLISPSYSEWTFFSK